MVKDGEWVLVETVKPVPCTGCGALGDWPDEDDGLCGWCAHEYDEG